MFIKPKGINEKRPREIKRRTLVENPYKLYVEPTPAPHNGSPRREPP